jgi:hypothetical protein
MIDELVIILLKQSIAPFAAIFKALFKVVSNPTVIKNISSSTPG